MVTSNHIHLLVLDGGKRDMIPKTLQLIAGRTSQEYNQRKNRKGAFWEDRYHATAVESDGHLVACLTYIDLNMVRAGVVPHPSRWAWSGYNEIQNPPERYVLIDRTKLMMLLGIHEDAALSEHHRLWVGEELEKDARQRESRWTENIAVGSKAFIEQTKTELGIRAKGRESKGHGDTYGLRETEAPYVFGGKNDALSSEDSYLWDNNV